MTILPSKMDGDSAVPAEIPQSEPLDDTQVPNNAGGYVYQIDDFSLLRRFIILGSNGAYDAVF